MSLNRATFAYIKICIFVHFSHQLQSLWCVCVYIIYQETSKASFGNQLVIFACALYTVGSDFLCRVNMVLSPFPLRGGVAGYFETTRESVLFDRCSDLLFLFSLQQSSHRPFKV